MPKSMQEISIEPLTKAGFSAYGDVVETSGSAAIPINQGFATRFNDLANIDVTAGGASVNVSVFVAKARSSSIRVELMERHPLGTQLFIPLQDKPWLVLVCADPQVPETFRAFRASGRQGVNYARNVWHHPLLVLEDGDRFLVIDRIGPGNNLDEVRLDERHRICVKP